MSRLAPLLSSLRVRLLALVVVAVLPSLAILLRAERNHHRLLVRQVEQDARDLARLVAEHHDRAVSRARGLLVALSRHPSLRRHDGPACSAELAPILEDDRRFCNLAGVDRDGDMFCSAVPLGAPVNLADRPHVRAVLDRGAFASRSTDPAISSNASTRSPSSPFPGLRPVRAVGSPAARRRAAAITALTFRTTRSSPVSSASTRARDATPARARTSA